MYNKLCKNRKINHVKFENKLFLTKSKKKETHHLFKIIKIIN